MTTINEIPPAEGMEVWVMQTRSSVYLEIMGYNRFGQPMAKELRVGPDRQGQEFHISTEDRLENQRRVVSAKYDPFRNGTFVRRDADQSADPNTVSSDALSMEALLDVGDLPQAEFEARLETLGEVPLRRLQELAVQMDIGHKKVVFLEEFIRDRYAKGSPQKSLIDGVGERLS